MAKKTLAFADAIAMASAWAGVEESTAYGMPALKVRGRLMSCVPSNRAAEPDSLVVCIDFSERDELLAADPDTYYLPDHYKDYPSLLVRLARIRRDALRDLLYMAWQFTSKARGPRRPARARPRVASRTNTRSRR